MKTFVFAIALAAIALAIPVSASAQPSHGTYARHSSVIAHHRHMRRFRSRGVSPITGHVLHHRNRPLLMPEGPR